MRVHYERSELIGRMRRYVVFHHGVHSERTRNEARDRVDDDNKRREDLADEPHNWNRVLACSLRMLSGDGSGNQLADYYMKQDSECEPGRPADYTQPHGAERASNPGSRCGCGSAILIIYGNIQSGLGGRKDCAHDYERNDPDQPGHQGASPTRVL